MSTSDDPIIWTNAAEPLVDEHVLTAPSTPIIVLCSDNNYVAGVIGTLVGVRRFASRPIEVHVLSDGITAENKQLIQDSVGPIEFHELSPISLRGSGYFTRAMWGRIFIAHYVQRARCLYLDCDLLVRSDVGSVWDLCVPSLFGAAVDSYCTSTKVRGSIFSDLPERPYYNSGVLLIDLQLARDLDLPGRVSEFASRYQNDALNFPDQDALNFVFHEHFTTLPSEWNMSIDSVTMYPQAKVNYEQAKVIHFCGGAKPWVTVSWRKTTDARSEYLALASETGIEPFVALRRTDRLASFSRRRWQWFRERTAWLPF